MHGHRIGYVRVRSFDQNPDRQLKQVQIDQAPLVSERRSARLESVLTRPSLLRTVFGS